jgi:ribosomal protein L11 methyltransferase
VPSGKRLRRVSITVPERRAEEARAQMIELFPEGFEERELAGDVELAAYTDAGGEERLSLVFGGARGDTVETGWENRWRRYHRPASIGPLWVGPPWLEPPPDAVAVVIDPGRAFGTGAHATTRLCLELLLDFERSSLLDVGCGSGVLAIAAAKLGFAPVMGVDFDPAALDATKRNAKQNAVEVTVLALDADEEPLPAADAAVVNISLAAVERIVPRVGAGAVLTSGYLEPERPVLAGYRHLERRAVEGWAADRYARE